MSKPRGGIWIIKQFDSAVFGPVTRLSREDFALYLSTTKTHGARFDRGANGQVVEISRVRACMDALRAVGFAVECDSFLEDALAAALEGK